MVWLRCTAVLIGGSCLFACTIDRAGSGVTGVCSPVAERCDEADNDCDGEVDEGFDFASDPRNCGGCNQACAENPDRASARCEAGECRLTCDEGFEDCNQLVNDGCEAALTSAESCGSCEKQCSGVTPLCQQGECVDNCSDGFTLCDNACVDTATDLANCGRCGESCSPPNSTPVCENGSCMVDECDPGFGDCDETVPGCEQDLLMDASNCGRCDRACDVEGGMATCVAGECDIGMCDPGRGNCDMDGDNGCETNTNEDPMNCGRCEMACSLPNSTPTCTAGACVLGPCVAPFDDCNADPADGCEVDTSMSVDHCGMCNAPCMLPNTDVHACAGSQCEVMTCLPGFENCDSMNPNGCEINTTTDPLNCGGCNNNCDLPNVDVHGCDATGCTIVSCDMNFGDCDGVASNGCEVDLLTSAKFCGGCAATNECTMGDACVNGMCASCPSGCNCSADCTTGACVCTSACTCNWTCSGNCTGLGCNDGSTCEVRASTGNVGAVCRDGSTCNYDFRGVSNAGVTCRGGSECTINCASSSTSNCESINCVDGARCALICGGPGGSASNCSFLACPSEVACPGGNVKLCNLPASACP
ncbi:MAG: hypothetical protein AAGF12_03800 [Myxococcota bacterium]